MVDPYREEISRVFFLARQKFSKYRRLRDYAVEIYKWNQEHSFHSMGIDITPLLKAIEDGDKPTASRLFHLYKKRRWYYLYRNN